MFIEKRIDLQAADGIATVTLTRSNANALDIEFLDELTEVCLGLGGRDDIRAMVLASASPRMFSAGVDHAFLRALDASGAAALVVAGQRAVNAISDAPFPTIAAVNGAALGGGFELALACDFIVASQRALFALPEVSLGLVPAFGGIHRLVTLAGPMRAHELAATGRTFNAEAALSYGLLLDVVAPVDLPAAARSLAARVQSKAARSLQNIKSAVRSEVDATRDALQAADRLAFTLVDLRLPR